MADAAASRPIQKKRKMDRRDEALDLARSIERRSRVDGLVNWAEQGFARKRGDREKGRAAEPEDASEIGSCGESEGEGF